MSALFTLPKQIPLSEGAILPGAKLYFYQTTTTTPQNTYQDNARTTPHANPVVADANGVFAAIYLDPTLPDYRVTLTTSADVTVYQQDGVPSNQNTQQSVRMESTNPFLLLYDTDGVSGSRKYRLKVNGATFSIEQLSNDESVAIEIFSYGGTASSFVGTLSGMTTTVTGTFYYRVSGAFVTIWTEANITGTSNATSMALSGAPAGIAPNATKRVACSSIFDNGTSNQFMGEMQVSSNVANWDIGRMAVSGSNILAGGSFTNSGTKGLAAGWTITYPLR